MLPPPNYLDDITRCLGAAAAAYANRKRIGGNSGKKGSRYEDFFAAKRLAEIVLAHVNEDSRWPTMHEQGDAFVDDLILKTTDHSHYYQLKNVAGISWTAGNHPLQTDFEYQATLSNHQGIPEFQTDLVVPDEPLATKLLSEIPASVEAHTHVHYFPYFEGSFNRLVLEHAPLRDCLKELTRLENPADDELCSVFGAFVMGIRRCDGSGSTETMFKCGRDGSPGLIRLIPSEMNAFNYVRDFVRTLAKIDGLTYGVSRGYFTWEAFGTSGILPFNCLSNDFIRFQEKVVRHSPPNFDDFEKLLPP